MTRKSGDRSVTSGMGVVLIVTITILLAASVSIFVMSITDQNITDTPQYSSVEITDVEATDGNIFVPELEGGNCDSYHMVITITHMAGDDFTSDELEYFIEVSGQDETVSERFTSDDSHPGQTASSGDEILIGLDGDWHECGGNQFSSDTAIVFADEPAWVPAERTEGGLGNLYNTFLDDNTDDIQEVKVTIIQDSTDTVIIDDSTTDISDHSN